MENKELDDILQSVLNENPDKLAFMPKKEELEKMMNLMIDMNKSQNIMDLFSKLQNLSLDEENKQSMDEEYTYTDDEDESDEDCEEFVDEEMNDEQNLNVNELGNILNFYDKIKNMCTEKEELEDFVNDENKTDSDIDYTEDINDYLEE